MTLVKFMIDDSLDPISVHGVNGIWGLIATGLFSCPELLKTHFMADTHSENFGGLFYGGTFDLMGAELTAIAVIMAISIAFMITLFVPFKIAKLLKVDEDTEVRACEERSDELQGTFPRSR